MLSPCCTFGTPQAHGIVPKKLELGVSELFPKCGAKNILEVLLNQVSKPRSWTGGGESWAPLCSVGARLHQRAIGLRASLTQDTRRSAVLQREPG